MSPTLRTMLLAVFALWAVPAGAQSYPSQPIRILVPIAAGSVTDVIMRAAAQHLSQRLGQQVVIENRGGANFIIGAQACAGAPPDGYTLCAVNNNSLSINPLIYQKLPYDADKDFVPIVNMYVVIEALAVSSAVPVNSVAGLRDLARSKSLNFGTLGEGSYPDLFLAWLNTQWHTSIVGVPYRGGGPLAQALVAGEIQVGHIGLGNLLGLLPTGKVKLLAVAAPKRSPLVPDVSTDVEARIGGFPGAVWWGLAAPRGTPSPIVERINREFTKLFREAEFVAYLEQQAALPVVGTPAEFARFLAKDRADSDALVKIAKTPRTEYRP
jgi:tripartite-type tricarboxylate transporter receptor subunit TctC